MVISLGSVCSGRVISWTKCVVDALMGLLVVVVVGVESLFWDGFGTPEDFVCVYKKNY